MSEKLKWFLFLFFSRVTILSHSYDYDIANLQTPAQPQNIEFRQRLFSGKLQSFDKNWFSRFNWIHDDCPKDAAYCFVCIKALSVGAISSNNAEQTFLKTGFRDWKNALEKEKGFLLNETSASHGEAIEWYVKSNTSNHTIGETLPSSIKTDKQTAKRNALMKIFANVRYLGKRLFNKRIIIL